MESLKLSDEVVVVNEKTGGMKGAKLETYSHMPVEALAEVARVYGFGAKKYAAHNFRKGYDWSLSYDAMQRHANAFWGGETYDPESGLNHMAHVAWHGLALVSFTNEHPDLDDRYKIPEG